MAGASPTYRPGRNLALKVPAPEFEATVAFYRDVLKFREIPGPADSATPTARFEFGDKVLWVDRMDGLSQSEIWLEIETDDPKAAATYLAEAGCIRRDEIEPLPEGSGAFWIASPSRTIHLVVGDPAQART